jgi:hypothetical protein
MYEFRDYSLRIITLRKISLKIISLGIILYSRDFSLGIISSRISLFRDFSSGIISLRIVSDSKKIHHTLNDKN